MSTHKVVTGPIGPRAWLPLGFVIGALLLLLVTPFITNRRVTRIRANVVDLSNEARVLVSEFEGAFAEDLIAFSAAQEMPGPPEVASSTQARERATSAALDSVVGRVGGQAEQRLAALRTAEARWRALSSSDAAGTRSQPMRPDALARHAAAGRSVIDAAEDLHAVLVAESNRGRDEVRRLEHVDLIVSAGLATIALATMAMVVALELRVRRYAAEADDRARKLERSVELRATLINGVVHDVKNPLGAAGGYATLLEDGVSGPLNAQQIEMIGRLKRLIGTAQQTVAELVELARVDAKEFTIERRETNLVSVLRRIVDDHQAEATRKSMALSFESPPAPVLVQTDPVRLRHVVENLLSNALKYTPSGGTVSVGVAVDDGATPRARIDVRDNGPGVPAELRDKIFDPFYRVPSSEHRVEGSGLGLAISRRIAGLLGGSLTVRESPTGGADFVLTLPIDEPDSA